MKIVMFASVELAIENTIVSRRPCLWSPLNKGIFQFYSSQTNRGPNNSLLKRRREITFSLVVLSCWPLKKYFAVAYCCNIPKLLKVIFVSKPKSPKLLGEFLSSFHLTTSTFQSSFYLTSTFQSSYHLTN